MTITGNQLRMLLDAMIDGDPTIGDLDVQVRVYAQVPEDLGVTEDEQVVEDGEYLDVAVDSSLGIENGKLTIVGDKLWD